MKKTKFQLHQSSFCSRFNLDEYIILIVIFLSIYSIVIVWSATGQNIFLIQHKLLQIIIGFISMIIASQISPRIYENWAVLFYLLSLLLLCYANTFGVVINGAQRWLNFGFINFQPSEIIKISVPLMIAQIVHRTYYPISLNKLGMILFIVFLPTIFIAMQPDLGTAMLIIITGFIMLYLTGIQWKIFVGLILIFFCIIPVIWFFGMHDYQRNRINILFSPERDPLGAGYHIIQSKIAIGSGGLFGKGWLHGSQSQLEFLPERHTDFIFAVIAEELGLCGVFLLMILYILLIIRCLLIAINTQNLFNKLVVSGITLMFFTCIFVNIGMVSGILPVVGIPLPLISYGGSYLITIMTGFGIIMSIQSHKYFITKHL
uniref:Peptidoglycan glycosyltransferase MrdB n=1 Tax=Candidatus Aschnera chinzeii TaxID=1485666 RepID=A0AAT9G559_9ENTR|nr:MAG: peptidoglycan glycosyltransferase MrdB [Candidatus Aschnera chinzeii]